MARQRKLEAIEQAEYVTIGELVRLTGARYSTLNIIPSAGCCPMSSRRSG